MILLKRELLHMLKMLEPTIEKRVSEVVVVCGRNNRKNKVLSELIERLIITAPDSIDILKEAVKEIVETAYRSGFKDGMYVVIKME